MARKIVSTRRALANQRVRDEANKAHAIEHQLRTQIRGLEHDLEHARHELAELVPIANEYQQALVTAATRLSDAELVSLAAVVHTEGVTQTPARQRLVTELQMRGILPSPSDVSAPERVAKLHDIATDLATGKLA